MRTVLYTRVLAEIISEICKHELKYAFRYAGGLSSVKRAVKNAMNFHRVIRALKIRLKTFYETEAILKFGLLYVRINLINPLALVYSRGAEDMREEL